MDETVETDLHRYLASSLLALMLLPPIDLVGAGRDRS